MKWITFVLVLSLLGNGLGLYLLDRALDYREQSRHIEASFPNQGVQLTDPQDIAQLQNEDVVSLIGGSLFRYWFVPDIEGMHLVNMGSVEESSKTTLKRMSSTVFALQADKVVINAGFCDIHTTINSEGNMDATLQKVAQNTSSMVERARQEQVTPIIATLTPVRPRVLFPYFDLFEYDKHKKQIENQAIKRANDLLRSLATKKDVRLIDFHAVLSNASGQLKQDYALQDGEHLNGKGYRALDTLLQEELQVAEGSS